MDTAVIIALITAASSLVVSMATLINQARTSRREHDLREGETKAQAMVAEREMDLREEELLLKRLKDQETRIASLETALDEERRQRGELAKRVVKLEIDLERACAERDRLKDELSQLKG